VVFRPELNAKSNNYSFLFIQRDHEDEYTESQQFQQEGVFWSNFGQLERVADIFIHKRYMRYSIITLFVVIAFVGVPRTTIFVIL
jgi:hypothetical protein